MSFDENYSEIYDALYSDKDYAAESDYIHRLLSESLKTEKPQILDVGMGTGRHAQILLSLMEDSSIIGLEPSPFMAQQARERGLRVIQADVQNGMPEFNDNSFDAILALFHVVSYLTNPKELEHFFNGVARCLRPGGIFVFDVWHKPAVLNLGMAVRVKRAQSDDGRQIVRIANPSIDYARSIGTVNYEIFSEGRVPGAYLRHHEEHSLRFFDHKELVELLRNSGLQVKQFHEFLTRKAPSNETWGVSYVAFLGGEGSKI